MPDCPAVAHFERVCAASETLAELAAGPWAGGLPAVLAGDELVLARMRAAADVVRAAGMAVDFGAAGVRGDVPAGGPGAAELLRGARFWQHYSQGPVSPLHRACGRDISRGLLRLWVRRQGPGPGPAVGRRVRLRQARARLLGLVRTSCTALRAELRHDAASLNRRQAAAFAGHVLRRVDEVGRELREAVDWELGDAGLPVAVPPIPEPAVPRAAGLENRLTVMLGAGFGIGTGLTLARLLSEAFPAPDPPVAAAGAAVGVALGWWVAASRRLLAQRAVLDRWLVEVTAGVRAALEEHVTARALAAEAAGAGRPRTVEDPPGM